MQGDRPFTDDEIDKLIPAVSQGKFKNRNAAFLQAGLYTGFRVSELLSLRVGNIVHSSGQVLDYIHIPRKFMKRKARSRTAPLTDEPRQAIARWLIDLRDLGWMQTEDYLFQSNSWKNKAISRMEAYRIIHNAARACGMIGKIGVHSLRKTYTTHMYRGLLKAMPGASALEIIRALQKALGHGSLETTVAYMASIPDMPIQTASRALSFGTKGKQIQMGMDL